MSDRKLFQSQPIYHDTVLFINLQDKQSFFGIFFCINEDFGI